MDKSKLNYVWLSPEGKVIHCDHEEIKAREILKERYGINDPLETATKWLLLHGWMAYQDDEVLGRGWMILESRKPLRAFSRKYGMVPTRAQKEKILELIGREFDDSMVVWNCVP